MYEMWKGVCKMKEIREKCINSADRLKGFATLTNIYIKKEPLKDTSRLTVLINKRHTVLDVPTIALKDHYYREFENDNTGETHLEKISYPEGMVGIYLLDITKPCLDFND